MPLYEPREPGREPTPRPLPTPPVPTPPVPTPPSPDQEEDDISERGRCITNCRRQYPQRLRDPEQARGYAECVADCRRETPGPKDEPTPECPEGKGRAYEGCPCGEVYGTFTGKCPPGYKFQKIEGAADLTKDGAKYKEGMIGRCVCQKAIDDWRAKHEGEGEGEGEFKWGEDVDALIKRLMGQANYLLDVPRGLTEEERDAIYNRAFEKIKGGERPRIQELEDRISRMGMLGSPFAEREIGGEKRFTGELLAGTGRDIEIEETERRFSEMMQTTQMAQQLTALGMSSEQAVEAINAARRGEGSEALNQLLSYFGMLYGGQDNSYIQAILAQLAQGGGDQGSIWDWLPYLPYLLGQGQK